MLNKDISSRQRQKIHIGKITIILSRVKHCYKICHPIYTQRKRIGRVIIVNNWNYERFNIYW